MALSDSSVFHDFPDLAMTRQAAEICTPCQWAAIKTQLGENRKMNVFLDFSLPIGYLYFIRTGVHNYEVHAIHGGIAPDGSVST